MKTKPEDFKLAVSCGPDYTSPLTPLPVNEEHHPHYINSPLFIGHVCVRVLNYTGTGGEENPTSDYFKGRNRRYSIMLQGDDILFGIDFDTPLRLPLGWSLGLKVAQWLDPNIVADLASKTPFLFSPLLCAMNSMCILKSPEDIYTAARGTRQSSPVCSVRKMPSVDVLDEKMKELNVETDGDAPDLLDTAEAADASDASEAVDTNNGSEEHTLESIGEWKFHSNFVPENTSLLFTPPTSSTSPTSPAPNTPDVSTYEKRKKHFSTPKHRKQVTLAHTHIYCMDFYDAYVDFNAFAVKLPGFSLGAFRYWDRQPLRFAAKTRDGRVLFVVNFDLVERD